MFTTAKEAAEALDIEPEALPAPDVGVSQLHLLLPPAHFFCYSSSLLRSHPQLYSILS